MQKVIDTFTLTGAISGQRIKGKVSQDENGAYVLNVGYLAQNMRFQRLNDVYSFCRRRGWDLGANRAAKVREAIEKENRAKAETFKKEFRNKMLKAGMLTADGREVRVFPAKVKAVNSR